MLEIMEDVERWRDRGDRVAVATVIRTAGSTPRPAGAKMAVSSSGAIAGGVSGGCLEGAVFEEAAEVLRTGEPRLVHYGISDEMAWTVGLSCGGEVDIFIEKIDW